MGGEKRERERERERRLRRTEGQSQRRTNVFFLLPLPAHQCIGLSDCLAVSAGLLAGRYAVLSMIRIGFEFRFVGVRWNGRGAGGVVPLFRGSPRVSQLFVDALWRMAAQHKGLLRSKWGTFRKSTARATGFVNGDPRVCRVRTVVVLR